MLQRASASHWCGGVPTSFTLAFLSELVGFTTSGPFDFPAWSPRPSKNFAILAVDEVADDVQQALRRLRERHLPHDEGDSQREFRETHLQRGLTLGFLIQIEGTLWIIFSVTKSTVPTAKMRVFI